MSNATLPNGQACCSSGTCSTTGLIWLGVFFMGLTPLGCRESQDAHEATQLESESRFRIRVLLLKESAHCTVEVPQGSTLKLDPGEGRPQQIKLKDTSGGSVSISIHARDGRIQVAGQTYDVRELEIWPGKPHTFSLDQHAYRGRIRIKISERRDAIDLINLVPLEAYLAGVVGAEMPPFWHAEALKVQAVVARTYCLHIKRKFGPARSWDLNKTQAHQVYQGVQAEHERVWDAVNSTRGQCLAGPGKDAAYTIFPTYYSAICGGHTENSQHVFGDSFVPLSGVPCDYCKEVAKLGQFLWPLAQYAKRTVSDKLLRRYAKLRSLGRIIELTPARQSDYAGHARITSFKLTGVNGKTDHLPAEDLRLTIDPSGREIQSAMCRVADWSDRWAFVGGRGWGHGVGLCQCGAQGLAKQGSPYQAILQYYFPGSRIIDIYEQEG